MFHYTKSKFICIANIHLCCTEEKSYGFEATLSKVNGIETFGEVLQKQKFILILVTGS